MDSGWLDVAHRLRASADDAALEPELARAMRRAAYLVTREIVKACHLQLRGLEADEPCKSCGRLARIHHGYRAHFIGID